jgi:hypothetical protein
MLGTVVVRFDVWRDRRWNAVNPAAKQFASVAESLTHLPASEAAAERLFSIFVCLCNERRLQSDVDLVEAEMIIRMSMAPPASDAERVACFGPVHSSAPQRRRGLRPNRVSGADRDEHACT